MKKIIKNPILTFILGALIFGSVGVLASQIFASSIIYTPEWKAEDGSNITNVEQAINELYTLTNSSSGTICIRQNGTSLEVAAKYLCELGDNIPRSFYIISVSGNTVKLLMEKNLSDEITNSARTMTYNDAIAYFDEGHSGYSTKLSWNKVKSVDLPSAQDIANAGGITNWDITTATTDNWSYFGVNSTSDTSKRSNYAWLYNYTRGCLRGNCSNECPDNDNYSSGYWAKEKVISNQNNAWCVNLWGTITNSNISSSVSYGVRPVITILKSQLAG